MYRFFFSISRFMAILGGSVLFILVIMTCLSIVGRELNAVMHTDWFRTMAPGVSDWFLNSFRIGEIKGSYEITESGMAFVIFAFLPITQMTAGHAVVDILTNAMPKRVDDILRVFSEVVFALALILIATQLYGGMASKLNSGQTTLHLEYPLWWGYAAGLTGAVTAAVVAVYMAAMRFFEVSTGARILPEEQGADH